MITYNNGVLLAMLLVIDTVGANRQVASLPIPDYPIN